jgi:hypothetical protein
VLCRQNQREERIVTGLDRPQRIEACSSALLAAAGTFLSDLTNNPVSSFMVGSL